MTKKITGAMLLATLKRKAKPYAIDGLGEVGIIQLAVGEISYLRAEIKSKQDAGAVSNDYDFGLALVVHCVVDDDGKPLLQQSDVDALVESNHVLVELLVEQALLVNGFKKAVAAKN